MLDMTTVREDIKTQIDSINEIIKQLEIAKKIIRHHPESYNRLVKYEINEILRILIKNNIDNLPYFNWTGSKEGYHYWLNLIEELTAMHIKIKEAI